MMTPIEPDVPDTGRYTITQAARILEIHRHTLRNYTEQGLIRCLYKPSGRKYYTGKSIKRLWRTI